MLVLTRKDGETLLIGSDIRIKIVKATNGSVKIGIDAPKNVEILREELNGSITESNGNRQ